MKTDDWVVLVMFLVVPLTFLVGMRVGLWAEREGAKRELISNGMAEYVQPDKTSDRTTFMLIQTNGVRVTSKSLKY